MRLAPYVEAVSAGHDVLLGLAAIQRAITDAESGQRGFLITGDQAFLEPYEGRADVVAAELARLRSRLAGEADRQVTLERLERLLERRFALLGETLEIVRVGDRERARTLVASGEGRRIQGQVRRLIDEMGRDVEAAVRAAERPATDAARQLLVAAVGASTLGVLFVVFGVAHAWRAVRAVQRAEAGLRDSATRYERLARRLARVFEASLDAICVFDADGRFVEVSPACERLWGYRPEELAGRAYLDMVVPDDRERTREAAAAIMAGTSTIDFWNRYQRKDGDTTSVMWSARWSAEDQRMYCVARDVTESDRLREQVRQQVEALQRTALELADARDEAQAADRVKSAFLATMSHELRTPLNSIIGFTGVLLRELPGPLTEEQRRQLVMVRDSARHLLALINDVLDISKVEAGQLVVTREAFDVRASVERVVASVRPQADSKGLVFRVQLADDIGWMSGDRRRVEQILLNLLSNAMKFTERGGAVTLTVDAWAQPPVTGGGGRPALRISVADTGGGIQPHDMGRLFRPFEQIRSGLAREHDGTGLGLAISRRLADLMGGTILVESRWQHGSTFTLVLPLDVEAGT